VKGRNLFRETITLSARISIGEFQARTHRLHYFFGGTVCVFVMVQTD
jgi:hypothetical protein